VTLPVFLLREFLERNARERGEAEALVTEAARYSHAALLVEARVVARGMLALGLKRGDHVGVLTGNDDFWVKVFYGAALIGCVTVPVNTRFKAAEIGFALKQADCRALFLRGEFLKIDFAAAVAEVRGDLPLLRHVVQLERDWPLAALADDAALDAAMAQVTPDDPLLIQFTSGTTAYPKGVLLSHTNMLRNAWACAPRLGIVADDRYLNCRPFFHVAGSTLSLLVCLVTGACMVTPPTFEAGAALRLLAGERASAGAWAGFSDALRGMVLSRRERYTACLPAVRAFLFLIPKAAAPPPPE
jgi:fatty-acyl-CoA synthase